MHHGIDGDAIIPHASARWARAVVSVVPQPHDPRTLILWSRTAGTSAAGLRSMCRMAGLSARRSLTFARLLRSVAIGQTMDPWHPANLLDVQDERTLRALLALGGLREAAAAGKAPAVTEFFSVQQLVTAAANLRAVHVELTRPER